MAKRNHVTFKASLPFDSETHPVGEEVATYLAHAIETHGNVHPDIDDWRDSGFEITLKINGKPLQFILVHVGDPGAEFYGQVTSYVGWIRRLFGYHDQEEQDIFIGIMHKLLTEDANFSEVSWHESFADLSHATKVP